MLVSDSSRAFSPCSHSPSACAAKAIMHMVFDGPCLSQTWGGATLWSPCNTGPTAACSHIASPYCCFLLPEYRTIAGWKLFASDAALPNTAGQPVPANSGICVNPLTVHAVQQLHRDEVARKCQRRCSLIAMLAQSLCSPRPMPVRRTPVAMQSQCRCNKTLAMQRAGGELAPVPGQPAQNQCSASAGTVSAHCAGRIAAVEPVTRQRQCGSSAAACQPRSSAVMRLANLNNSVIPTIKMPQKQADRVLSVFARGLHCHCLCAALRLHLRCRTTRWRWRVSERFLHSNW